MSKERWVQIHLYTIAVFIIGSIMAYFYFGGLRGLFYAAMGAVLVFNLTFSLFLIRKYYKNSIFEKNQRI